MTSARPLGTIPSADDHLDSSLQLLRQGYGFFPDRRRVAGSDVVRVRVLGQRAVCLTGPDAARFFYSDELERSSAIPLPIQATLFGHGAVHTLDGDQHRRRKALFTSLLIGGDPQALADACSGAWRAQADAWRPGSPVVLFDEGARALLRGVCGWVGIGVPGTELASRTADMVAMVDGFGSAGPRHLRARLARRRSEAWVGGVVTRVRAGALSPTPGSPLAVVSAHRDVDGELLEPRLAAVELLNLIRPTVAVAWFIAYAGHALTRWPHLREQLRGGTPDAGGEEYATAFVHELRRFYPFAPFLGARTRHATRFGDTELEAGTLVLLDVYGQHHDDRVFPDPYAFAPGRWVGRFVDPFTLIPQGGGDTATGHRCPGEHPTVAILTAISRDLASRELEVPDQDMTISLRRMPARVRSGVLVRPIAPDAG